MRSSRLGILILIVITFLTGASCSYYNKIIARKDLVDGATAYKERKFAEAENLFREIVNRDPQAETLEGKTARLFLARTLHSRFIANRKETQLAEDAIEQYKQVLATDINDQSSFKAVVSLLESLGRSDEALQWINDRANNAEVKPEFRAEALTSLAARKYSCANDISDVEPVKKTVKKDGKEVYQFTKPENPEEFNRLVQCTNEGLQLIDQALALEPPVVKELRDQDVETITLEQTKEHQNVVNIFQSVWSYKANLLYQKMRIAEMDNKPEEKENFKKQGDEARDVFKRLQEVERKMRDLQDAEKKAQEEAANTNKQ